MTSLFLAVATGGLVHLLILFLLALVAIVVIGGLIWAIETYIIKQALPNGVRLVIGLVLIVIIVILVLNNFGGAG